MKLEVLHRLHPGFSGANHGKTEVNLVKSHVRGHVTNQLKGKTHFMKLYSVIHETSLFFAGLIVIIVTVSILFL